MIYEKEVRKLCSTLGKNLLEVFVIDLYMETCKPWISVEMVSITCLNDMELAIDAACCAASFAKSKEEKVYAISSLRYLNEKN